VLVLHNDSVFTSTFLNGDVVTYKVNATDNGCYSSDTVTSPTVLMLRDSTPTTPWISLILDELVANTAGTYRWYWNSIYSYTGPDVVGPMAGITLQAFVPTGPGYYWCVRDTTNCASDPSNILYINLLKVNNVAASAVKLYPNPTTGILNLEWNNNVTGIRLEVFDIMGQLVSHEEIKGKSHHETDLSHLPDGNYMVVLRDEEGNRATYKVYLKK
jgi:hypothetical protein